MWVKSKGHLTINDITSTGSWLCFSVDTLSRSLIPLVVSDHNVKTRSKCREILTNDVIMKRLNGMTGFIEMTQDKKNHKLITHTEGMMIKLTISHVCLSEQNYIHISFLLNDLLKQDNYIYYFKTKFGRTWTLWRQQWHKFITRIPYFQQVQQFSRQGMLCLSGTESVSIRNQSHDWCYVMLVTFWLMWR